MGYLDHTVHGFLIGPNSVLIGSVIFAQVTSQHIQHHCQEVIYQPTNQVPALIGTIAVRNVCKLL